MNKTLYLLWFSDIFILTGFGLATPILAIFITENIIGGSVLAAGIASALFMIVKACVQIPFSRYVDSHENKVKWLWLGTLMIITVPIQYLIAKNVSGIYIAQITYGVGAGLAAPAWLSLWTKNLDKDHEGFEWSIYSATVGLGTGAAAFVGGLIATYYGFSATIITMGAISIIGMIVLLYLSVKKNITANNDKTSDNSAQYHKKHKLVHNQHHR